MWLVILNSKIKAKKNALIKRKLTWEYFVKNFLFDSLFLVNLSVFSWDFCVLENIPCKATYIVKIRGLEWLPDDVVFVPNLSINAENLSYLCFWNPSCVRRIELGAHAECYACRLILACANWRFSWFTFPKIDLFA